MEIEAQEMSGGKQDLMKCCSAVQDKWRNDFV